MKYTIIISVFIVISHSASFGQICSDDSTFYKRISTEVDTLVLKGADYLFNSPLLTQYLQFKEESIECNILNYALVFDVFVTKGVILNERLPKPNPRNNRFSVDPIENERLRNLYKDDSHIFNIFFLFVNIKQEYEMKFIFYNTPPDFERIIDDVLKYCPLSNPKIVRDMLLGKYRHINRKKFDNDMRYYEKH